MMMGVRRPHDWPDVLGSIANYLVKNGYNPGSKNYVKGGDIWKSVWAYNHSDNYVMAVLGLAEKIRERSSYLHSDVENRLNYVIENFNPCLLYTSPSPRDKRQSRMPSSA